MRRLTERFAVPIMADEGISTPEEALLIASKRAADAFSVKITKHGGMVRTKQVAGIAQAAGIKLFGGTMIEGQIGTSAYAQIFSTMPNLTLGAQLFGPHLLTDNRERNYHFLRLRDGCTRCAGLWYSVGRRQVAVLYPKLVPKKGAEL